MTCTQHKPFSHGLYMAVLLVLFSLVLSAQQTRTDTLTITAQVLDSSTSEPIPYASIYIKEKGKGTISDLSGRFTLNRISAHDTVRISFIGYADRKIIISASVSDGVYYLQPKAELLNEITIYSTNDYLYELVNKVSKTQVFTTDTAKSYYSLESRVDGKLVELLECYYNGIYNGYNVNDLKLKNGRVALSDFNNRYFMSSETSRVMYLHRLFSKSFYLPNNPLSYGKAKLKRYYELKLISKFREADSALIYVVDYTPKKKNSEHFGGTLWIDSISGSLQKIVLKVEDASVHPFIPLGYSDSLTKVDMRISRTYQLLKGQTQLQSIDFQYRLEYKTTDQKTFESSTRAVLYAYNYSDKFKLPFFKFATSSYEDYRKISAAPYNHFFWSHRDEFAMATRKKEKEYFIKHHAKHTSRDLFSDKAFYGKSFFEQPYIFWDPKRVVFADDDYDPSRYRNAIPADRYKLTVQIYLDINQTEDSAHYITSTVFDPFESYYHYPATIEGQAFINMYFDLVEIHRRKLDNTLANSLDITAQADSIYRSIQSQKKTVTDQFLKDVDRGTNRAKMQKWNEYIQSQLQIDNLKIFGIEP